MILVEVAYGTPTELPTSMPSPMPSPSPTHAPVTMVPTRVPTVTATSAPTVFGSPTIAPTTAVPSFSPTSYPTVPINTSMIVFGTNFNFIGVSADSMNNNIAAQESAKQATAESMGNGVTSNMLIYYNATDISNRRLRDDRKLSQTSCDVNIIANIPIQTVDSTGSADSAYYAVVNSLNAAVSSGAYSLNLQDAAAADGASDVLGSATVSSVTEEIYTEYSSTASPSAAPTSTPSSDDDAMDAGTLAGIVIGSIVGFFLVCGVLYYCMKADSDEFSKSEATLPPFRKPRSNPDSNLL